MPGDENKTHALDEYSDLVAALGQQKFKRNVSDFSEVKGGLGLLKAIQKEREQDMEDFKAIRASIKPLEKVSTPSYLKGKKIVGKLSDIPVVAPKPKQRQQPLPLLPKLGGRTKKLFSPTSK